MAMLGMDVDLVSGVAGRLAAKASDVESTIAEVDRLVESTVSQWFGADAAAFVQEWQTQHRAALASAAAALGVLTVAARRNVAQQLAASGSAAGGSAPVPACTTSTDGHLRSCLSDVTAGRTPTDVSSLLGLVKRAYTQPGGVAVSFTGSGAERHAIVAVSGTETWGAGGDNPDDLSTNVLNAYGRPTLKQEAIDAAMRAAGVRPSDQVLLVGHSQGGADAIYFASDPAMTARYDIVGVVTAAAPETTRYPPSSIPVVELRAHGDVVPGIGSASLAGYEVAGVPGALVAHAVHDATMPSNVSVVELPGPWQDPVSAHGIANYVHDSSKTGDPVIGNFVRSHRDFFDGEPATTYTYSARRVGDGAVRYE